MSAEMHDTATTQFIAKLEREREEALQAAGRLRARVEELEGIVRDAVGDYSDAVLTEPEEWLWRARVALGLDGATGDRDINAEVAG